MGYRYYRRSSPYAGRTLPGRFSQVNQQSASGSSYTKNQIALQTFVENGFVAARSVDFAKSIAYRVNATPNQLYWVDKLVKEILEKQNLHAPAGAAEAVAAAPQLDASKIFTLFDNARKHLKYPKIALMFADKTPIRLATSRNHPDTVFVSAGGYGTQNYCRLSRAGAITRMSLDAVRAAELVKILTAFAADPEKVAQEYGKLTHNCCYCLKQLDTPESLAVGYGPICADHYGLMWGKKAPRTKPNVHELLSKDEEFVVEVSSAAVALDKTMNELLVDQ